MSGPDYWAPTAGAHQPPDGPYNPASQNGQTGYSQSSQENSSAPHHSYDPNSGYPIPPGFVPPREPSAYDSQQFPPPPREEYRDNKHRSRPPPSEQGRSAYEGRDASEYGARGAHDDRNRPYAPADPRPNDGNALTPYDEEKAEANWREEYEDDQRHRYNRGPPPRSTYDDRDYDDRSYDGRERDAYDPRYDPRDRRYDPTPPRAGASPDSYYDYRDRNERSRRDSRHGGRSSPKDKTRDFFRAHEGDRGIGAQVLGGAAGALAGHELGHSLLDTIGGAIVGAVGAKVLEKQLDKRKLRREDERTENYPPRHESAYDDSRSRYPASSRASTRGPDVNASRSRSVRSRSRSRRSVSRSRAPRSRSRSWDSDE